MTNSLFDRTIITASDENAFANVDFTLQNNLLVGGSLNLLHHWGGTFTLRDNLFDDTAMNEEEDSYDSFTHDHNTYTTNVSLLSGFTFSNVLMAVSSMTYDTGPLGRFYLPTNSPLINAGSTNANLLGLYYHTSSTNQLRETNSVVNAGFHYMGLHSSGLPTDSDMDGIPDYQESLFGDGLVHSGDSDWNNSADVGPFKVYITRPKSGTSVP